MEKKQFKRLLAVLVFLHSCLRRRFSTQAEKDGPVSRSDFLLNTFVTVTLYDSSDEEILDQCMALCREYENRFSKTIATSEIYGLNHRPAGETVFPLTKDTAALIREGLYYSRVSDGAFDITIEPLSSLWNFTDGKK